MRPDSFQHETPQFVESSLLFVGERRGDDARERIGGGARLARDQFVEDAGSAVARRGETQRQRLHRCTLRMRGRSSGTKEAEERLWGERLTTFGGNAGTCRLRRPPLCGRPVASCRSVIVTGSAARRQGHPGAVALGMIYRNEACHVARRRAPQLQSDG
ncbi:MAG: hypothetical protein QM736_26235 [Vicinamibacterales bacterium]